MVLIVALTEVKPQLISFVYIVGERRRERAREGECWKGGGEAATVIVPLGSGRRAVGVGRRERRLVFCL